MFFLCFKEREMLRIWLVLPNLDIHVFLISCILHEVGIKQRGEWVFANGVCLETSTPDEELHSKDLNLFIMPNLRY